MNFSLFSNKQEISKMILRAELSAPRSGVSVFDMLGEYAKEIEKDKPKIAIKLQEVSRRMRRGEKRWNIYKNYVDSDILNLLEMAEQKSIPASKIFQTYIPIKELSEKYIKSIKNSLKSPLGIYLLLSVVFSFVVEKFRIVDTVGNAHLSSTALFIIDNFLAVTGGILVFIVYALLIAPQTMPLLKGIFKKLNSMLVLSTTLTMFEIGYSSAEIISILAKQFNLKVKRQQKDSKLLVMLLKENRFVDTYEGADIKIGIVHGSLKDTLQRILEDRLEDAEGMKDIISDVVKNISLAMMAIPIVMTMIVMFDVMMIISSISGG